MKKRNHSIQFRLNGLFVIVIIVPLLMMFVFLPKYIYEHNEGVNTRMTQGLLGSMASNIDIYLSDLERVTLAPYLSDDILDALRVKKMSGSNHFDPYEIYITNKAMTEEATMYFQLLRDDVTDVLLLPLDGSVYLVSEYNLGYDYKYNFTEQRWYIDAIEANGRAIYIGLHEQDYLYSNHKDNVFSVARAIKDPMSGAVLGIVVADTDVKLLEQIARSADFGADSITLILDGTGQTLYTSAYIESDVVREVTCGEKIVMINNEQYEVISRDISSSEWKLAILLSCRELASGRKIIYISGVLTGGVWVILMISMMFYFSSAILKPFDKLVDVMHRVGEGDFGARFHTERRDEVAELGERLNDMISQMNRLIAREHEAIETERRLEYESLQAQIRPHFLYNTFNGFIGLNRAEKREELEEMIFALSDMMRYTYSAEGVVPLCSEIEILSRYCELQKLRFGDRLEYEIMIADECKSMPVPKLLLQPLVENSVIHGIEPLKDGGKLIVKAWMETDRLCLSICDNGTGFNVMALAEGGTGLHNVSERLKFVYPKATFQIFSAPGEGCEIRIVIPKEVMAHEMCDCG